VPDNHQLSGLPSLDDLSGSQALRRLAEELELAIHLGDQPWGTIRARLAKLERWFERSTTPGETELAVLACVVRKLRQDGSRRPA
jgi:hypothetical protein